MKLGRQTWLASDGARRIVEARDVAGDRTRLGGGAVRDDLLGLPVSDVDFATQFEPGETMARLKAAGVKAVPTGIAHGTVTAVTPDLKVEVTTLRRDVATDGRHATVAFTDDWRADASRRDFTINALYANPISLEISDFFDSVADLDERRVRFIGVAFDRIAEDHLRILRFFRFHARFGRGAPDAGGLAACAARANDLMALSRERVRDELLKLLVVDDPVPTLGVMCAAGIFAPMLPEVDAGRLGDLARLVAAETALGLSAAPIRRLAVLLPHDAGKLDAIATRLRLSNAERRRLVLTAARDDAGRAATAYRDGLDTAVDRALLAGKTAGLADFIARWRRPDLPISGRDLIARGVPVGPAVSRTLGAFEAAWVGAGFPADTRAIDALVADVLPR